MKEIDNSGAGNCMYYAYSISLMYFLRSKCTKEQIDIVFNNLQLPPNNDKGKGVRADLHALIDASRNRAFTDPEHKTIERILGPVTRKLAADSSMQGFRVAPTASHIHPVACFYMALMLKREILALPKEKEHALAKVLNPVKVKGALLETELLKSLNTFEDEALKSSVPSRLMDAVWDLYNRRFSEKMALMKEEDKSPKELENIQKNILLDALKEVKSFAEAELVQVEGMEAGIGSFAKLHRDAILKEFNELWTKELATLSEGERSNATALDARQERIFKELVNKYSINFFMDNKEARLKQYGAHLNTDYRWGITDVLFCLHQAVTGERSEKVEGRGWVQRYDVHIDFTFLKDGRDTSGSGGSKKWDIVLNNFKNIHWVSLIPPEFYPREKTVSAPVVTETATPPVVTKPAAVPVVPIVSPTSRLMASSSVSKPDRPFSHPEELRVRENLLEASGFNLGLTSLATIKNALYGAGYGSASDTANVLYDYLVQQKETFLCEGITINTFSRSCRDFIDDIPKHELQPYRTLLLVVNFLLNSLIALLTLTTANWYYGKFQIIKPSCYTNSLVTIEGLRKSVSEVENNSKSPGVDPVQSSRTASAQTADNDHHKNSKSPGVDPVQSSRTASAQTADNDLDNVSRNEKPFGML